MPTLGDVALFFTGQAFGQTTLPANIDLSGKTIVVTGANSGLGLDACRYLARMQVSHLVMGCRNVSKGEVAKRALIRETGCDSWAEISVWEVDLDSYASVQAFNRRVTLLDRLDGVIANAGVEITQFELSEGLERDLNVNVVSTYLLCLGVLPKLVESARVHNIHTTLTLVGSLIHYFGADAELHNVPDDGCIFEALSDGKTANMRTRYALSKLVQHMCFNELVAAFKDRSVTINLVNPGWCGTELGRHKQQGLMERFWFYLIGRTSEEGSRTLVHAVCAGEETHGKYMSECTQKRQSCYVTSPRGTTMAARLWQEVVSRLEEVDKQMAKFVI